MILRRFSYLFLTLSLLMGFGWTLLHSKKMPIEKPPSLRVDATAKDLSVQQFDTQGRLMHLFTSPGMQHFTKTNTYVFQNPRIVVSQEEKPSWNIHSKVAIVSQEGSCIVFKKDVVIHQNSSTTNPKSTLKTEKIRYYPKEKKASTDQLITFKQAGHFIQSRGMKAYLDEKRVELLHQARGSYVQAKS